jgi:hypothetical protein
VSDEMMAATERLRLHWHTTHTLVELTLEYQLERSLRR